MEKVWVMATVTASKKDSSGDENINECINDLSFKADQILKSTSVE